MTNYPITNILNKLFPANLARQKRFGPWNLVLEIWLVIVSCILVITSSLFAQDISAQRIISLGPVITRQLSLLDVEDKIVGVTTYCNVSNSVNIEKIGTVTEVNLEKILMLNPDIVFATNLTNPKAIQKLKNLNINVMVFNEVKSFNELCGQFIKLAQLVNKEKIGREIISRTEEKLSDLSRKNKNLSEQKVIVQIGANPLWVATKNSLINDFVLLAGGINTGPKGENGLVSREYIVKQNPDVIIIIEMGILAEEEKENWLKFETINAVKQNRIHVFDSYDICSPTPLSFIGTLESLSKLFHPEIEY